MARTAVRTVDGENSLGRTGTQCTRTRGSSRKVRRSPLTREICTKYCNNMFNSLDFKRGSGHFQSQFLDNLSPSRMISLARPAPRRTNWMSTLGIDHSYKTSTKRPQIKYMPSYHSLLLKNDILLPVSFFVWTINVNLPLARMG